MFRVMAVDDEPSALEFLCQIVGKRCPDFEIVGRAFNGRECLDMLNQARPDVLLSDIKMPVMDGIELAKQVHAAHPEIIMLLISGYQEFEYAHSALKYGVYDYLLKPIVPSALSEVFSSLRVKLEQRRMNRKSDALRNLCAGENADAEELKACFPEEAYGCVLARRNGLPKRFAQSITPDAYEIAEDGNSFYGRDEMERVFLCPAGTDIRAFSRDVVQRQGGDADYITAVYMAEPFSIEMLPNAMRRLYRALEKVTVLGVTQVVPVDWTADLSSNRERENEEGFQAFEHYMKTGDTARACKEFEGMMRNWEAARIPQLSLERKLRYMLFLCSRMDTARHLRDVSEHLLDDAFYYISSMSEMRDYMEELLFSNARTEADAARRMDSPEQFERIRGYVLANIAEPLTLEALGMTFGISQSYISKMFRKYENRSFNTFLMESRMESACTILRAHPETLVKDVAQMVGYPDPFYFSRCFRAYAGMSPRDYAQRRDPGT